LVSVLESESVLASESVSALALDWVLASVLALDWVLALVLGLARRQCW